MLFWVVACNEEDIDNTTNNDCIIPISIANNYPVQTATRADDNGFVTDDAVGIFVVAIWGDALIHWYLSLCHIG